MCDRHQAAAAVPAKIRDPSVVGACVRLRQFHVLQFGFVGKAEGRVDQRRVEAFLVEAFDALLRIHRAERIQLPVGHSCREIMIAIDRSHRRESAEPFATLGVEYIEIGGRPSKFQRGERLSRFAAMGSVDRNHDLPTGMTYGQLNPLGAMDPKERVERLDKEGLDAALIYPTLSLSYETELQDVELAQAYTRAYNRWIADFCRDSGGRLVPIAHLSLGDPQAAARELERAVKDGCKGAWVCQLVMTRKPHAHSDHQVVFAKTQGLDVPFGIHPSLEPIWALPGRYEYEHLRGRTFFLNVTASDAVRPGLTG